jgi:hypothetical protein
MHKNKVNPAVFDGRFITEYFFPHLSPMDINFGDCCNWAYIAYKVFHKCNIELWSTVNYGGHAFIKMDGKFYDSESLNGVTFFTELECFRRGYKSRVIPQTFEVFRSYWNRKSFDALDERLKSEGFM